MNQITWMDLFCIDNKAWRLHDKTIHLLFFVLLILNEQRYQTLNDNKKDDIDVDHKDTWKKYYDDVPYFISPSVSPSSSLCIFFIPPFLLPNIWKLKTSMLYKLTHFYAPATHILCCNILTNIRSHPDDKVYNKGVTN